METESVFVRKKRRVGLKAKAALSEKCLVNPD
jgi:hypothetical protein